MLSGGADSTNMFYSFVNHNIWPDEVIASAPLSGLSNFTTDPYNHNANNIVSETFLAQIPLLNKISQLYGNKIRCTVNDYFHVMTNLKSDHWLYEDSNHWVHPSGGVRWKLDNLSHIKKLAEQGKRIAVVVGLDKPYICRSVVGNLYSVVMDSAINVVSDHFSEKFLNVETILFYYSSDLPDLMIKQAHMVCRWFYQRENVLEKNSFLWDRSRGSAFNRNSCRGSGYQRTIVPIIYPMLDNKIWQADKQSTGLLGGQEVDSWLYKIHNKQKFIELTNSDTKLFFKNINVRYWESKDDVMQGFKRFYKHWLIGHESQFLKNSEPINIDNEKFFF